MRIICPNCDYAQDIPEAKIPPRSVMATCPKCGEKFKFRELDPALLADLQAREDQDSSAEPAAPAQPETAAAHETNGQEPPSRPAAPPSAPPLVAEPGQEQPPRQPRDGDIWQRLEGLAGDETGHADGDARDGEGRDTPPPWERLDEFGFFPGLTATVKQAMFNPRGLFEGMPVDRGMARPLIFYLLISEFAAVCQFVWQMLGMDLLMQMADQGVTAEQTMITGAGLLAYLVIYPLLLAGGLFVSAGLAHLVLMIVRAAEGGFEGTFRVVAYSAAPIVLSVFPFAGSIAGALWSLCIMLIGLRWVHRASYLRIILGLHIPLFAVIALALIALVAARLTGGM